MTILLILVEEREGLLPSDILLITPFIKKNILLSGAVCSLG